VFIGDVAQPGLGKLEEVDDFGIFRALKDLLA
jgi:hypothetical protein